MTVARCTGDRLVVTAEAGALSAIRCRAAGVSPPGVMRTASEYLGADRDLRPFLAVR